MMMVLVLFGVLGSAAVAKYAYDRATDSMYAREVARTYGEAFRVAFHAGKALTALPENSKYVYETRYWKDCELTISSRFVLIERTWQGRPITAQVALPVPLVWRSTKCYESANYAYEGCNESKANEATGIYTDAVKFENEVVGKDAQEPYACGVKLRFDRFTEAGQIVPTKQYERLWVREIEGVD